MWRIDDEDGFDDTDYDLYVDSSLWPRWTGRVLWYVFWPLDWLERKLCKPPKMDKF